MQPPANQARGNLSGDPVCAAMLKASVAPTVPPELCVEPAWAGQHRPASGAVMAALRLPEDHGWKHVRHVVAMVAQVDLGARLAAERGRRRMP